MDLNSMLRWGFPRERRQYHNSGPLQARAETLQQCLHRPLSTGVSGKKIVGRKQTGVWKHSMRIAPKQSLWKKISRA